MPFFIENPLTEVEKFLMQIETELSPGLITQACEWVMESFNFGLSNENRLEDDSLCFEEIPPEHIAAALFIEATTQEKISTANVLRITGHAILKHCGH